MFLPEWEEEASEGLKEVRVGGGRWLFIITLKCGSPPLYRQNPVVSFHLRWVCNIRALNETIFAQSKRGYGFICHRKCPLFRTQPHSFLLLQQCPDNHALPPPVSRNLILLFVPSSAVRVCLTDSALPLILPAPPYHIPAPTPPPRPGKGFVLRQKGESHSHLRSLG